MWGSKDWKGGRRRDSGRWRVAWTWGSQLAERKGAGGGQAGSVCACSGPPSQVAFPEAELEVT